MYLSEISIKNFRQFGDEEPLFHLVLSEGVTALVGENDSGKTAVIDAIRYALLTRDLDYIRPTRDDFHISKDGVQASNIIIVCKLRGLSLSEKGAFAEYLTYESQEAVIYIHWSARRLPDSAVSRRWVEVAVRSGPAGAGPSYDSSARQLLASAYLRPLRDAEREMSSGRGSRLSQILSKFSQIKDGVPFDKDSPPSDAASAEGLTLDGMASYLGHLVEGHQGVKEAQRSINDEYLARLSITGQDLHGRITFAEARTSNERLREILEQLELDLQDEPSGGARGSYGLGSNNLLFMACELLLLGREDEGLPLLLIEEPEAHLHPQRQLRLMQFLLDAAKPSTGDQRQGVQVIVTTHSPNLASKIPLGNLVLLQDGKAFSLAQDRTMLDAGDYRFLERFLDVTKANLFFARGLMIVEGVAEDILVPAIAKLLDKDLTRHGVSIINVGGTGLRRYARILQRKDADKGQLAIPTACVTDMDVMPDCAPEILGIVSGMDDDKWKNPRKKWKVKRELGDSGLVQRRQHLAAGDGQCVKTFVADEWTLEYDLAFAGLAKEVFIAAELAASDDAMLQGKKSRALVENVAESSFEALAVGKQKEELCSAVYERFHAGTASKAVAAQYLTDILEKRRTNGWSAGDLAAKLPEYLKAAIDFATRSAR